MKNKHAIAVGLFAALVTPLVAGTSAPDPQAAFAPAGFTLDLDGLFLRAFQGNSSFTDDGYDFAGRAVLGYQFNDSLFTNVTYFGYHPGSRADTFEGFSDDLGGNALFQERFNLKASYLDWTVGKNFKPTADLSLSPSLGLRWATFDEDFRELVQDDSGGIHQHHEQGAFEGLGLVAGVDGTRALGNGFSLYGTAKASVMFGKSDYSRNELMIMDGMNGERVRVRNSDDQVVTLTELGIGAQYDFSFSNIAASLRAGVEGQLWSGLDNSHSEMSLKNTQEIAGFVLGAHFRF